MFFALSLDAVTEEAAGGEEFGVEESGTGGSANKIVREQSELNIQERTFADAADDGGHAVSGLNVAAGLRAIVTLKNNDGTRDSGRQRSKLGGDLKIAQRFADFIQRSNLFQA